MAIKTRHTIIVIAILLAISPFIMGFIGFYSMAKSINDAKEGVRQLDHISIRDAGRELLSGMDNKSNRMIENSELPDGIRKTDPKFVHYANGVLYIEYGGGFAHYGLAIPTVNTEFPDGDRLTDGIFYYEAE